MTWNNWNVGVFPTSIRNCSRAVANACGKNPYVPIVPCHRVIRSDGKLGGYSGKGGINTKKKLLMNEGYYNFKK